MPSHNVLIQRALSRAADAGSVRAGTQLQDKILKVRRCKNKSSTEFEIALGELFVCASDAFKERNSLRRKVAELAARVKELEAQLEPNQQNLS